MSRPAEQLPPPWLPLTPIALALQVFFTYSVVAALLPVRLLDQAWQLSLISSLVNNGPLALMGLAMVHLHAWLMESVAVVQQRRDTMARLAVAAALGFLLLVPLQVQLMLGVLQNASVLQAKRIAAIERDYRAIRGGLNSAGSTPELAQLLQQRGGPQLAPALLSLPLPELRQRLLANLTATRLQNIRRLRATARSRFWGLLTSTSRNVVCSLALATGFAAGASWPGSPLTLLEVWQEELISAAIWLQQRLPRHKRPRSAEDDYIEAITKNSQYDSLTESDPPQQAHAGYPPSLEPPLQANKQRHPRIVDHDYFEAIVQSDLELESRNNPPSQSPSPGKK